MQKLKTTTHNGVRVVRRSEGRHIIVDIRPLPPAGQTAQRIRGVIERAGFVLSAVFFGWVFFVWLTGG